MKVQFEAELNALKLISRSIEIPWSHWNSAIIWSFMLHEESKYNKKIWRKFIFIWVHVPFALITVDNCIVLLLTLIGRIARYLIIKQFYQTKYSCVKTPYFRFPNQLGLLWYGIVKLFCYWIVQLAKYPDKTVLSSITNMFDFFEVIFNIRCLLSHKH